MYGGSGSRPNRAIASSTLAPITRTTRCPSGRTSTVSTATPSPSTICLPACIALPGFPIAIQVPSVPGWMSSTSAGAPEGRVPSRRAWRTRVVLRTRRSPGAISDPICAKCESTSTEPCTARLSPVSISGWRNVPLARRGGRPSRRVPRRSSGVISRRSARNTTSSRLADRSASGSWATSSGGRS